MSLLGPDGKPISSQTYSSSRQPTAYRKDVPERVGEGPGHWAGRDVEYFQLPGGSIVQFNLNNLTLADYRTMRDHYQVNASQSVLMFMVHQADWRIECEDQKIADHCEANLREIWTRLVRAMSQAYWAGFSPSALQWENDLNNRTLQLTKVKDLLPEDCTVNWKDIPVPVPGEPAVPGAGPRTAKVKVYDGINQRGWPRAIPVANTFWYPLLMENGNYYGRKLLRPAFSSWFFSILMHLFSNRYFERFGEPVPVGRAPYDEEVTVNGETVQGNVLMETVLTQLRNRSVVVLPNSRTSFGDSGQSHPDYDISYLESAMRGADFTRYLNQLDEEISLALFTPLLILRTADVGSYNLGIGHMQMYLWMLNALLGDKKEYIDRYILSPMVNFNFSPRAPRARIVFRKLGKESAETVRAVLTTLVGGGGVKPDLTELGQMAGMTLEEVEIATEPPGDGDPGEVQDKPKREKSRGTDEPRATGKEISARIRGQVTKAFNDRTFGPGFKPSLGYRRRFEESLRAEGYADRSAQLAGDFYRRLDAWLVDVTALGVDEFPTADAFMGLFDRMLETEIEALSRA